MTKQAEKEVLENQQNKVWVNLERTVNLGNYNNVKFMAGESRIVEEGKDPVELREEIANQLVEEINDFVENKT